MIRSFVVALVFVGCVFGTSLANAEPVWVRREPNPLARRHFYLGAEGVGSVLVGQTGQHAFLSSGGGLNLFLGGRIHRSVALEFGWQPTFHGQPGDGVFGRPISSGLGLEALTFDVKILPFHGRVQPFFVVGPGLYFLHDLSFNHLASGGGYQIGGGVDFWLLPVLSLGLKAQYRGAALLDYDSRGATTYLSMLTFGVNLTGRF